MKIIHLSDLHLGKRVNGFSMLEDQRDVLIRILNVIDDEKPQAVLIAGDVYDKSVPSAEAVTLFDDFLCRLAKRRTEVFIISGNHDSAERLSFASSLIDLSGIHLSPVYDGDISPFTLSDGYGKLNVYMLPFIKPIHVRAIAGDETVETYTDALAYAVGKIRLREDERNILVTHQFVTGAQRCESEEQSVGGTDNVDASVFDGFDYVALGHLHGAQSVSRDTVRYCGTPLKYSFSEVTHQKSVTVLTFGKKGEVAIKTVPLTPLHDMREIKGTFEEVTAKENYENTDTEDYMRVILTDENDIPDVMSRLRVIYPNLMEVRYDNRRTRNSASLREIENIEQKSETELFAEFFEKQNGQPLTDEQAAIVSGLFDALKEEKR